MCEYSPELDKFIINRATVAFKGEAGSGGGSGASNDAAMIYDCNSGATGQGCVGFGLQLASGHLSINVEEFAKLTQKFMTNQPSVKPLSEDERIEALLEHRKDI